jgi:sirohydrochlorin ferrochelatase
MTTPRRDGDGAVVLVAHGSRDVRFADTARRVRDAVAAALPGVQVELSFLDLNAPLVDDVLSRSSGDVTVVPLLFGDGYHSKIDLPATITAAHRANPGLRTVQTPVIGSHSPVPALCDRLHEAGVRRGSGVLLYAVGSSDTGSDESIRARGRELSSALQMPVETVFATRLESDGRPVAEAVQALRAAGARSIAASPLFLSAGLLTERVERWLDVYAPGSVVAGPLGAHPAIVDAVTTLHRAAFAVV